MILSIKDQTSDVWLDFPAENIAVVRAAMASLVKASSGAYCIFEIKDDAAIPKFKMVSPDPVWQEVNA